MMTLFIELCSTESATNLITLIQTKANLWLTSCFQGSTGYSYSKKLKAAMSDSFERRRLRINS